MTNTIERAAGKAACRAQPDLERNEPTGTEARRGDGIGHLDD